MQSELNYKDILLQPNYSILNSRTEANTSVALGNNSFNLPIMPANMATVVDEGLCHWLASNGYFYVMHRFDVDTVAFVKKMHALNLVASISLGVNEDSYDTIENLLNDAAIPDYVTIDIAHGACEKMKNMISAVKKAFPKTFLIAGNVCTADTARMLCEWGANCTKIGIGPGSVCVTKLKTGFSRPQFSAVLECSKICDEYGIPCIADGGIEHNGDIAKALVAGADMVMVGGMLSGFDESPGRTIVQVENGRDVHYKEFYGSASEHNKKEKKNIEGRRILVPLKGSIKDKYAEITQDLQSSISYAGGNDLTAFRQVKYVVVHRFSILHS